MTVSELIERLKELPGDPDLRAVVLDVTIQRPYASDARVECSVYDVGIRHDTLAITGYGYLE